jgi:CBS domain containing-hemolysin-like protein
MAHSLIKVTGGDPEQEFTPIEAEEIESLVASSAQEGGIDKYPAALIDRVFSFGRRTVKDIMVPRTEVVGIDLNEDIGTVADLVRRSGHSRMPIYQETMDEIVGIFHVKDLLLRSSEKQEDYRLKHHLHPPYYVPETATLGHALRDFQKRRIHMAIVVDEFGGTEGIITLEDILEELVGEIQDEFDQDAVMIRRLPSGTLEVAGLTTIEDLKRVMPELKEREIPSKTVGGLIMEAMGKVPQSGESVEAMGIRFTVISSSERQIKRVKVEPLD